MRAHLPLKKKNKNLRHLFSSPSLTLMHNCSLRCIFVSQVCKSNVLICRCLLLKNKTKQKTRQKPFSKCVIFHLMDMEAIDGHLLQAFYLFLLKKHLLGHFTWRQIFQLVPIKTAVLYNFSKGHRYKGLT